MEIPQIQQQLQINRVLLAANHMVLPDIIVYRNHLREEGYEVDAEREHKVVVATRKVIARYANLQKALKKDMQRALFQEEVARVVARGGDFEEFDGDWVGRGRV